MSLDISSSFFVIASVNPGIGPLSNGFFPTWITLNTGIAGQWEQQRVVPQPPLVVPMPRVMTSGFSVALPSASTVRRRPATFPEELPEPDYDSSLEAEEEY